MPLSLHDSNRKLLVLVLTSELEMLGYHLCPLDALLMGQQVQAQKMIHPSSRNESTCTLFDPLWRGENEQEKKKVGFLFSFLE
jgi:hypothetical protein